MSQLSADEIKFYRDFYKVLSDPKINDLFVKYATVQYNKAVDGVRRERTIYDYGYSNGAADCWKDVINLKAKVTEIMKNVG